jgi:hypothetical protein
METTQKVKKTTKPVIGKYIIDTLSIGMYNHPLMLFREYVQNSSDAIDEICKTGELKREDAKIEINIDGQARSLIIKDNGGGVPAEKARSILFDIGLSSKRIDTNRGFRGIGRLGGLGYCKKLRFVTKAKGEKLYSESIWDCEKIKELICGDDTISDISDIIGSITQFYQHKYNKGIDDHFFIVEMNDVKSSRNMLIDVPIVNAYLSEVAPVPFNHFEFSYSEKIEKELKLKVPNYEAYNVFVNGEQIFKPYKDIIAIGKKVRDKIENIKFIEFNNGDGALSFGWIADLKLLGTINPSNLVDGIRIRTGNILIGDKNILSGFFREKRFNNYLVGELHIVNHKLIPNSRRDDFEDNIFKDEFYNCFIKEIGIPFSLKVREASEFRSQQRKQNSQNNLVAKIEKIIKEGYLSEEQKKDIETGVCRMKGNNANIDTNKLDLLIGNLAKTKHCLDINKKKSKGFNNKKLLKSVFDIIYNKSTNKSEAEEIIHTICSYWKSDE